MKEGFGVSHYVPIMKFIEKGEDEIEVLKSAAKVRSLIACRVSLYWNAHHLCIGSNRA